MPSPDDKGTITLSYKENGDHWFMSVRDDGIGMPKGEDQVTPGLGTSLVQALAQKLDAKVSILDAAPGTLVCISH